MNPNILFSRARLNPRRGSLMRALLALLWLLPCLGGCAVAPVLRPANERPFDFSTDTPAFNNQTEWVYRDGRPVGKTEAAAHDPSGDYSLHCFVLSRSVRQFFQFARFDASQPALDDVGYRKLIHQVIAHDPDETRPRARIVIPGYPDLRSFSVDREPLLKAELGGAQQSYLQRGNWRMVFPFSRDHQAAMAQTLLQEVRDDRPPVVHLVNFPTIDINHAVMLYDAAEDAGTIRFTVYDPNDNSRPTSLIYDRGTRTFTLPANRYFPGGEVQVYEVYRSLIY